MVTVDSFLNNKMEFVNLSDIAEIFDSRHETPEYSEEGIPMVRVQDVQKGYLSLENCKRVSQEVYDYHTEKHEPKKGEIILSRVGSFRVSYVNTSEKFCLGQNTVVICPKIDSHYLFYILNSKFVEHQIESLSIGSVYQTLSLKHIKNLNIPIFSVEYQKLISQTLFSLDSKISLNTLINSTLESLASSLFHSWFVRFDPFQDGEFVASELGLIPKSWQVKRLEDITNVIDCLHIKKPEKEKEGKLLLQVFNIGKNGKLDLSDKFFVSDRIYDTWISRIEVKRGDIIISKTGRVGAVAQIPNIRAAIGRNLVCINPIETLVSPEFLKELMLSKFMKNEIRIRTSSGTILQSLHVKDIKKLRTILPPRKIMERFTDLIEPLHEMIIINEEESLLLSSLRDFLLPQLLGGKLRINNPEKFLEEIEIASC
ncbi:MAG: restriction endonuclease subunit S [Candidatus Heimdallarchaeaceae archaeon]